MRLSELSPFVRFAAPVRNGVMPTAVKVTDCRIFYVEAGSARISIGELSYPMEKGSLFYCCGGSEYTVHSQGDLTLICLNFDLDQTHCEILQPLPVSVTAEHWDQMPVFFTPVSDSGFLCRHLFLEDGTQIRHLLRELTAAYAENTELSRMLCNTLLKAILLQLHRLRPGNMPPKIALVQQYITRHYDEDITNDELARLAGYHAYYLNRAFRAHVGMSIHKYLLQVRLEQAVYLMRNTNRDLNDIAESVGFHSYPHFSGYFKQVYGTSPQAFRKT